MLNKFIANYTTSFFLVLFIAQFSQAEKRNLERVTHLDHIQNKVSRSVVLMTTDIAFFIVTHESEKAQRAIDDAVEEIRRVETLMSEWRKESDISRVNKQAGVKAVSVKAEVFLLIEEALRFAELTNGKFDPSFKSAGKLWDFRKKTIPKNETLTKATNAIGYKNIVLNQTDKSIYLKQTTTQIGLGGIAKGYAVDRAVQIIRNAGFKEFTVNAGGDLYAAGDADKKRWRVGIQDPRNTEELIALLPVSNAAVATSGDYERYFERDGVRYHHILDPKTGYPASLCQSVTIIAPRTYIADALATGVFVLGPDKGMALVESIEGAEAVIIDHLGSLNYSSSLKDLNKDSSNAH